jgi:integrase
MSEPTIIKLRGVVIRIYEWRGMWRFAWTDRSTGKRKYTTRKTLEDARAAARDRAAAIGRGAPNIDALTAPARERLARLLDADPQLAQVDAFFTWHRSRRRVTVRDALDAFFEAKRRSAGISAQNIRTLTSALRHLDPLGQRNIEEITTAELETIIHKDAFKPRTRSNHRSAMLTFFRWCREKDMLPEGKTAADRTEKIQTRRKIPCTYTPDELKKLLENVRPEFLPWLALSAFAGMRADEIMPIRHARSKKSPLDWSDFAWDRKIIIVRPETDKNGQRRVVPICAATKAWLEPIKDKHGPVSDMMKKDTETKRLGELIGGWKPNALRHSFISYRAALVGISKAAMEAGNSESEARRSYNDAKSKAEAVRWFAVMPGGSAKVPQ